MAGPGGGPSRRSHTKSRKGCKTCKRRHIRCDETFPQCRNCTKHQVRCDYMDNPTAGDDGLRLSAQAELLWTPEIERTVDTWRQTGQFPFPELGIYPPLQCKNLSRTELRLLYHICTILNEVQRSRMPKLTVWTDLMPKILSVAASYHFVMHAVFAFAANHLAYVTQSSETRNIAFHHAGVSLKGLHEAISAFTKTNSDAILAASLLLTWQSTDWRNWASLMGGTKAVMQSMQQFRAESIFSNYLAQQPIPPYQQFTNESTIQATPESRQELSIVIQSVQGALQRLQPYLTSYENESKWIDQLNTYMERLRTSAPAYTPEEQFSQLYQLRKLLLWVPVSLVSAHKGDIHTLLVLSHFYSAAMALEPVFPDIGPPFLSSIVRAPLEEIMTMMTNYQSSYPFHPIVQSLPILMDFPRDTLARHRSRRDWLMSQHGNLLQPSPAEPSFTGLETLNIDLGSQFAEHHTYQPSLSPAFASSTPHLTSPPVPHSTAPRSPFLEVPHSGVGGYGFSTYPTSTATYHTATPVYTVSPIPSPAYKSEADSTTGGYQLANLTLPAFPTISTAVTTEIGLGPLSAPVGSTGGYSVSAGTYPASALPLSGGGLVSGSGFPSGCVTPAAVWT